MIPILKRPEQCIGRGFAVWDEEHEVARKYVCTGVECRYEGSSDPRDDDGSIYVNVHSVRLYQGSVFRKCWYDAGECYASRGECMMKSIDKAIAANADNPEKKKHFEELKAKMVRKLEKRRKKENVK